MNFLLKQFELLADAPNGITKLRELILQLAVQGKLVQQDPNEEPASELLKRIKAEKEELIAEGKIKNNNTNLPIDKNEVEYSLPSSWIWTRFGECSINRDGERIPVSREERSGRQGPYDYYGASGIIDKIDRFLFDKPLLLIGEDGANLINRSTPIAFIAQGKYWVNNHAHVIDGISFDFLQYLCLHINAIDLKPYVTGTAQPKMNQAKMNSIPIALPPLAEQNRIVAKVDQLMKQCDELEQRQQKRDKKRTSLNNAALEKLTSAANPNDFQKQWFFIADHFNDLYSVPENVSKLKSAILQLAVQGKLVPQNPNDEPASELLKRIKTEKEKLIAEGKIKKDKLLPPIREDEIPYAVPGSWVWCRLQDAGTLQRGKSKHRPRNDQQLFIGGNYPLVQTGDVSNAKFYNYQIKTYTSKYNEAGLSQSKMWQPGTLCITIAANIAETGFLTFEACFPDSVVGFISAHKTISNYVNYFLIVSKMALETYAPSTAQKNINLGILNSLLFPLPPLAEQKRIVAKVEQLMNLCDELEERLKKSQQKAEKFAGAVVAGLSESKV